MPTREILTAGMITSVSTWSPWHLRETLSTFQIYSLIVSWAPPPPVSTIPSCCLLSYSTVLLLISLKNFLCFLPRWHVCLLRPWLTRIWQWRIRPWVLLPSLFKWVSETLPYLLRRRRYFAFLCVSSAVSLSKQLTMNCCVDRDAHQERERRLSTKASPWAAT